METILTGLRALLAFFGLFKYFERRAERKRAEKAAVTAREVETSRDADRLLLEADEVKNSLTHEEEAIMRDKNNRLGR